MADLCYRQGRPERAVTPLKSILEKDPKHFEATLLLANALRELGNRMYMEAGTLQEEGKVDMAKRTAEHGHRHHTNALDFFNRAMELRGSDPAVAYGAGLLFYHRASGAYSLFAQDEEAEVRRNLQRAVEMFEKVVQRQPNQVSAHRYLGLTQMALGEHTQAVAHLQRYQDFIRDQLQKLGQASPTTDEARTVREEKLRMLEKEVADLDTALATCRAAQRVPHAAGQ